jgi:predicted phage-related endonuclease
VKDIKWSDGYITTEPIKKNKKITGTHFPTVLGANPFSTPFEVWCRCTRTYEIPFEGNKYTNAGQIIEPKVFTFLRNSMGFGDRLITPEDVYGKDHFKKTWGDFYPNTDIYGGMWDALITDEKGKVEYVVEIKTVQVDGRSGSLDERWKGGEAPGYQALQASLYAYLLGVDKVLMVAVALKDGEGDYEHPEKVEPSFANENVYIDEFKVSERYPNFDMYIAQATDWWNRYVLTGISPEFDEKKDAEILKALRTNNVEVKEDITSLLDEAEKLKEEIDNITSTVTEKEKQLKSISEKIKKYALEQFREGDTKVSIKGKSIEFMLSKSVSNDIDKERLESDGLLEIYSKQKTNYRLTMNKIKELYNKQTKWDFLLFGYIAKRLFTM